MAQTEQTGKIANVTAKVKSKIKALSAYSLPDNPSARGKSAADIKKAFFEPIVEGGDNVIDEIDRVVNEANNIIGSDTLTTSAKTLVGAINENKSAIDQNKTAISTNKGAIGTLADLKTKEKASLVGAINENNASISSFFKRVEGKSQSYVLNTFEEFIRLLAYDDGVGFYCDYLNTGDNLLIVEREVPDFWYEKIEEDNLSLDDERITSAPTYTYQGKEYSLAAVYDWEDGTCYLDGVFHILENDFSKVKELLHEKLLEKVDKIQNVSTNIYVYAESPSKGTILYGTSYNATKNTIPLRYNGGVLDVGTPTANDHAVNLGYLNGQITPMQKQITLLEKKVGFIETEFVTLTAEWGSTLTIPEGALPFAQLQELHGDCARYCIDDPADGNYMEDNIVYNYPVQLVAEDGRVLFSLPEDLGGKLPEFGLAKGNYIYFKDGKAIYHQEYLHGPYEEFLDPPTEGATFVYGMAYNEHGLWRLPEILETDVTELVGSDGVLNIQDVRSIRVVMKYSEADIDAMTTESWDWSVGRTKITFEV